MTGIVVVAHSPALANAAVGLARDLLPHGDPAIAIAAGAPDGSPGTNAEAVAEAVESVDGEQGVVVLSDVGSALLSAETALDLLPDAVRRRVILSSAPLVEGLVAASVTAALGGDAKEVAKEADGALIAKRRQLGVADEPDVVRPGPAPTDDGAMRVSFTLTNAHGLHARPAALLVAQVKSFHAHVRARNVSTGSDWIDAASLTQVTTLGARPGQQIELTGSGPEAQRALNAIVDLAKGNFGESDRAPTPAQPAVDVAAGEKPASPGYAVGPLRRLVGAELVVPEAEDGDTERQWRRLEDAFAKTRKELIAARAQAKIHGGPIEAAIFDAHLLMLEDEALLGKVRERIEVGQGAARAWSLTMTTLAVQIGKLDDPYLRTRAVDAKGLRDQVLRHLLGAPPAVVSGVGILVAPDLSPSDAAALDPARTLGVVLTSGSPMSHAAIVARSKSIPMVTGAGPKFLRLDEGTELAIDGTAGEIVIEPDGELRDRFHAMQATRTAALAEARERATSPAVTLDGLTVPVLANIGSIEDAFEAVAAGADGAGLVRTEFLFASRATAPTREEQEHVYRQIAEAFDGRRIVIRTLDAGGDKPLDFLAQPIEPNPFLGVRGIRLMLRNPALLIDQLAAICAVAEDHPVSVMFPMVADVGELIAARRLLSQAARARGRPVPPQLRVGIMIEVPTAALKGEVFAPLVDFFSIGTNDLTQYAMAAERGNAALASLSDSLDPGVLRLIASLARGAKGRAGVSVCGELAADPLAAPLLVGMGVTSLSVAIPSIGEIKDSVRSVRHSRATRLASRAQRVADAAGVRWLLAGERV